MPTLDELQSASGSLHDALAAGIADISQATTVSFTVYQKVVLPLDGYVYWLRTGSFEQAGAIHFSAERQQEETETRGRNTIIFTTQEEVQDLNTEDTQTLAVGEVGGQLYSFGRYGWFFPQAGVYHYQGDGVPVSMSGQLVDDPSQIDPTKLIVSDSLPAWLQLVSYDPVWISWPAERNPHITLYPSYLVPDNLPPPYGVVHIEPSRTEALQSTAMWMTGTYSHYQLTKESVRVTLYGCNNDMAADWLDLVEQYTLDTDAFGITNMPTIRDGKRPWPEGMVIAQLKTVDFEVSYVQTRIDNVARQLITSAIATVLPEDFAHTTGFGDPDTQASADIQAGAVLLVALGGSLDGAGGLQAATQARTVGILAEVDGAGSLGSFANIKAVAAVTVGAQAGIAANITVRTLSLAGSAAGAASISGACIVHASATGVINGVAG